MKTKLACLLLTAVATLLVAQVPPPPTGGPGSRPRSISEPVRPVNPSAPASATAVATNAPGTPRLVPNANAPEPFRPPPGLPLPGTSLTAPTNARPTAAALPASPTAIPAVGTSSSGASNPAGTNVVLTAVGFNAAGEELLDPSLTSFKEMPLGQVLEIYSELTGRTVLRSPAVQANTQITLVTKSPLTRQETIQAIDSILALNSITIIPTGQKFLTVVPSANAMQEGAAFNTNATSELPEASQYITKIIQVTNAKPSEVVAAIQPFAKVAGGILPIDATGVLVLRDNAINIKRMLEVLEKIDKFVPSEEEFKVIPVNYALAADVAQVLGSFTASGGSAGGTANRTGAAGSSTARRTGSTSPFGGSGATGLPGSTGVGGATPFGTQPGMNPAQPGAATPGTASSAFQSRLNQIVSNITGGRAGAAPLLGEAKIIPYDRSNSLLVLANKSEMAMLTNLLAKIDVPQQQVLIEALIFETDIGHTRDTSFGIGQQTGAPGSRFSGRGGINSVINFSTNATVLGVGAATGGFAYLAQLGANWAAAVQMLESDSKTEVLSRPRIQTSHAEAANIFSGGTTPYVTGSISGTGFGTQQQIQQLQIGINMSVLPLITSDGLVVLDINQTIEGENGTVQIDANLKVPKTVRHTAQAKVAVKDGETIILGGLIRTAQTKNVSGVPVLKDIPGLGFLFRSTSENPTRKELMVLIRPTVLATPHAASLHAQAERQRSGTLRGVEQTVREEEDKLKQKQEQEEIEAIRRQLRRNRGVLPPPDPALSTPPPSSTEKNESTDFLGTVPKTGTP